VELADRFGVTLIGFTKASGFNIYTHPGRIDLPAGARSVSTPLPV
jgi:formate dehydrogenase assembly factor FdhD